MLINRVIAVQFNKLGKLYYFSAPKELSLTCDSYVIVNTSHGRQIGRVAKAEVSEPTNQTEIQPIERVANDEDMAIREVLIQKEAEALEIVRRYLRESSFQNVKAVSTEYGFETNRITIFLNYDNDSNFEMKTFLRDISKNFRDARIEVRQIGPRDMAKALSGLGACGIEQRCCSRFLTEFSSISIKMAKSQDISLTPGEITGMCGRLRCCLIYEHEMYEAARANLPKRKKLVQTPLGGGKVVQVLPLADSVIVDIPESGPRTFTRTELETGVMEESKIKLAPVEEPQHYVADVEFMHLDSSLKSEGGRSRHSQKHGQTRLGRRNPNQSVNRQGNGENRSQQRSDRTQSGRIKSGEGTKRAGVHNRPVRHQPQSSSEPATRQPSTDAHASDTVQSERKRGNYHRRRR